MTTARLYYLFKACLNGAATPEEQEEWRRLARLPEHEALVRQLLNEAYDADKETLDLPADTARAIFETIVQQAPVRRLPWYRRRAGWAAAAAILILLGIGVYLSQTNLKAPVTVTTAKDVAPGRLGAILTLADGSTVVLDSAQNGQIAMQGGTQVTKQNGRLAYVSAAAGDANIITYNTISTPRARNYQVQLPDGSRVWLNAASSLRYPTAFTGLERTVELTGEAYFEIAPNKKMPFRVKVSDMTVEVLGTHFNIMAYTNENSINTTLLEGSVKVFGGGHTAIIRPGEQARLTANNIKVVETDVTEAVAWKNGLFQFNNADLKTVMRQLERWYDVEVVYENGASPNKIFRGKLQRDLYLSEVLEILKENQVAFRMEGRKIIIQQ